MWNVSASPTAFDEAVAWFRGKVPIPDPEFRLLSERARQRAFFISGISRLDVLADAWGSLRRALEQGTPYAEWAAQAGPALEAAWGQARPWQTETIFRTNIQSSYSAGRWQQLSDPDVRQARPYWMYDAVLDSRTTDICRTRNGTVRPADDSWWRSNWPPLHYNCRSGVRGLTPAEAEARGLAAQLPDAEPQDGFGASPGASDWADSFAKGERSDTQTPWESAFTGDAPTWRTYGRPERLPTHPAPAPLLPTVKEAGEAAVRAALQSALGPLPSYVSDPTGFSVLLDSRLFDHLSPDGRERFLSWLPDLIQSPEEIWLVPMKKSGGNAVVFRQIYLKLYSVGKQRPVVFVAEFHRGVLVGLTFFPTDIARLNKVLRKGILRYSVPT